MFEDAEAAPLSLTTTVREGVAVVHVDGVLDATTRDRFADHLAGAVAEHGPDLVLDLSGVSFMDSRALGLIVHFWQTTTAAGGTFAIVGVEYAKTKLMWVTGLAHRLPLYDTLEAALAARRGA